MDSSNKYLLKWVNMILKPSNMLVTSVKTDFKTGLALVALLEQLTGYKAGKKLADPKNELFCLNNIYIGIQMIQEGKLVRNLCVDARNFYSGQDYDEKLIFGFIFELMLHHSVMGIYKAVEELYGYQGKQHYAEKAERDALFYWCNLVIAKYGLEIKDFTTSWLDGMAYSAIAASVDEACADIAQMKYYTEQFSALSDVQRTQYYKLRMQRNLYLNESVFGVAQLLDEEFIDNPSEKANIMYISQIFKQYNICKQNSARQKSRVKSALDMIVGREMQLDYYRHSVEELRNAAIAKLSFDSDVCAEYQIKIKDATPQQLIEYYRELESFGFADADAKIAEFARMDGVLRYYYRRYNKINVSSAPSEVVALRRKSLDNKHAIGLLLCEIEDRLCTDGYNPDSELAVYWKMQFEKIAQGKNHISLESYDYVARTFGIDRMYLNDIEQLDFDTLCDFLDAYTQYRAHRKWVEQLFKTASGGKESITRTDLQQVGLQEDKISFLATKLAAHEQGFYFAGFCCEFGYEDKNADTPEQKPGK